MLMRAAAAELPPIIAAAADFRRRHVFAAPMLPLSLPMFADATPPMP